MVRGRVVHALRYSHLQIVELFIIFLYTIIIANILMLLLCGDNSDCLPYVTVQIFV